MTKLTHMRLLLGSMGLLVGMTGPLGACGSALEGPAPRLDASPGDGDGTLDATLDAAEVEDVEDGDGRDDLLPNGDVPDPDLDSGSDPDARAEVDATGPLDTADGTDPGDVPPADAASNPCEGLADDSPCDDGNLCTLGDRCLDGRCLPIEALRCDDGNPCTDDTCRPDLGCVALANLALCDDGDPCTANDRCLAGACRPGAFACDDLNPCTRDTCAPDGTCAHVPDDSLPCEDGSACTGGDFCADGFCIGGLVDGCASSSPCIASRCADDGLTCRVDLLDGLGCDDGSVCTVGDQCLGGICRPGTPLDCGWDTECGVFRCDRVVGCILESTFQAGKVCSDDDRCTTGDKCDGNGRCIPETLAECDDNNPCTQDSCDATWGCQHTSLSSGACNDQSLCTTNDTCQFGQCRGTAIACNDFSACTVDSCDPLTGCQFLPIICDDGNPCTEDSCDPDTGCIHVPRSGPCDDQLTCTTGDTCLGGVCTGIVACDDGDPCTVDLCDADEGCLAIERIPCPVGLLRVSAVGLDGAAGGGPGFGQWVALRNDGELAFVLDGWSIVGRACDCEAPISRVTVQPGATVYGLRASDPVPTPGELANGGPTSAGGFAFTYGSPGDSTFFESGDLLELVDETGAVVSTFLVP